MVSFALNYYATGGNPFYFKLTNLVIHMLNGLGLYFLTRFLFEFYRRQIQLDLTESQVQWISLAVAAAWLLHPLGLTSVLYVVQRMTSLSAGFTIWALALFVWARGRMIEGRGGMIAVLVSLLLFFPLAVLSKENGALLPAFMLIFEMTIFRFTGNRNERIFLGVFYGVSVVLPALLLGGYTLLHPEWITGSYGGRDFSLAERLMTEARALWFYIKLILLPRISDMGLYHDDFPLSSGLLQPLSTLWAVLGLAALFLAAIALCQRAPLIALGVLFFLVGHVMESSVLALEIMHEHRNYLPMYGLLLPFIYYLLYPSKFQDTLRWRSLAAVGIVALFSVNTYARSTQWANPVDFGQSEAIHHPLSTRANFEAATIFSTVTFNDAKLQAQFQALARYYFQRALATSTNDTGGAFGLIFLDAQEGKPLDRRNFDELTRRLRYSVFVPTNGDRLLNLVRCQMNGGCNLSREDFDTLFTAALNNPTIGNSNKAMVFNAQNYYLNNIIHDTAGTIAAMHKAIEVEPSEIEYRFNLIRYLMALHRYPEAKQQLLQVRSMDKLSTYKADINIRLAQIAALGY
ncbi:tetratricopeptide repeat protein [Novimethylophilus kurashikiensis]|nr:pilus assembly protein PilF [Novimethylophilus kurashikiensis]